MKEHKFASGAVLRSFPAPPAAFDVHRAVASELEKYGLPPRLAGHASWTALWKKLVAPNLTRRNFRASESNRKHPAVPVGHASPTWSGVVATAPAGTAIWTVGAGWQVQSASVPNATRDPSFYFSSSWIGIDGWGASKDLLQVGFDCDASLRDGVFGYGRSAWVEWRNSPAIVLDADEYPVQFGDEVACAIVVASPTSATVYITNSTQNWYFSSQLSPPAGQQLAGSSVEWIVERPQVDDHETALAKYSPVTFDTAIAYLSDGRTPVEPSTGFTVNMYDGPQLVSTGSILANVKIMCTYVGPA